MKKEIAYWELKFDGMYFGGTSLHNGIKYSNRQDAVEAVNELVRHLNKYYLTRMGRKIIHEKHWDKDNGQFDDKYWYRLVVIDCHEYSHIVSFGCERHVFRLK